MEAIRISDLIQVSDYYRRLTALNQDAEIALRSVMSRPNNLTFSQAVNSPKRFRHQWSHNKLNNIYKRDDWYFSFTDENEPFDCTVFTLSELPLESKLILIDILQKL